MTRSQWQVCAATTHVIMLWIPSSLARSLVLGNLSVRGGDANCGANSRVPSPHRRAHTQTHTGRKRKLHSRGVTFGVWASSQPSGARTQGTGVNTVVWRARSLVGTGGGGGRPGTNQRTNERSREEGGEKRERTGLARDDATRPPSPSRAAASQVQRDDAGSLGRGHHGE